MRVNLTIWSIILVLCAVACSSIPGGLLPNTRAELPDWIKTIEGVTSDGMIYVQLDERAVWEPGDEHVELSQQITNSLEVTLDGTRLPTENVVVMTAFTRAIIVYDEAGHRLGSHRGETHVYILTDLSHGLHKAAIEVTTSSGGTLAYQWWFTFSES